MQNSDWTSLIALIISIIGVAVSIFNYLSTVKRENKINTLKEFSNIRNKYSNLSPYAANCVSDDIRKKYLREMERFCTGVNVKVYDIKILYKMSGHFLITQYDTYLCELIKSVRSEENDCWKYCQYEKFIDKLKKQSEKINKNFRRTKK